MSNQGRTRVSTLDLFEMMPKEGDKIVIVNTGYSFEVYSIDFEKPQLVITPEEIEALRLGMISWN